MIGLNANAVHQYINLAQGALAGLLASSGCITLANNVTDCSASTIPPQYVAWAMLALVVLKFVINIGRDGLTGLLKIQPPVADQVSTVVLTSPANTSVVVSSPGGPVTEMKPATGAVPKSE